jgi:hypothetical protein
VTSVPVGGCAQARKITQGYRLTVEVDDVMNFMKQRPREREGVASKTPDGVSGWSEQPPLAYPAAIRALAVCVARTYGGCSP